MTKQEVEQTTTWACFGCGSAITRATMVIANIGITGNDDLKDLYNCPAAFCRSCTGVDQEEDLVVAIISAVDMHVKQGLSVEQLNHFLRALREWEPGEPVESVVERTRVGRRA